MTNARDAKQTRKLERPLDRKPPQKGAVQSLAALQQHVEGRLKQRRAYLAAVRPLLEKVQAPLREMLAADEASLRALAKQQKKFAQPVRRKPAPRRRPLLPDSPQMGIEQGFLLKFPPYDQSFQYSSDPPNVTQTSASEDAGIYSLFVNGASTANAASAGIGVWFFAYEDNPMQRVAAIVDYEFEWVTRSLTTATAHNDAATNIWVWGFTEGRWVAQTGSLSPYWSDGTGWFESHGSGGYPASQQFGRESLETFFPAAANNFYLVWIWSEGSCDDSGTFLASSYATQQQGISVPMITFGSL